MRKQDIFEEVNQVIMSGKMDEKTRTILIRNLARMKQTKANIMFTGATGAGKSSTINALFDMEMAKVGVGSDPETMGIGCYQLDNVFLWDTPGLGDGMAADNRHAKNIVQKLNESDENGNALIDLVVVVLDGGSRDLGTSYELINKVIIPNLGNRKQRILIAINQADMAMKGRYWNFEKNEPEEPLKQFLDEKVESVKRRIKEGTGMDVDPIYYCAGYREDGIETKPYNLAKLMYCIVEAIPDEKVPAVVNQANQEPGVWKNNNGDWSGKWIERMDKALDQYFDNILDGIEKGGEVGRDIGEKIGGIFGEKARQFCGDVGDLGGSFIGGLWKLVQVR